MAKTEKQKMLSGELYLVSDTELLNERKIASRLLRTYNSTTEEQKEERSQILQELFGEIGQGTYITPPFYCDYGKNIYAGDEL